MVQIIQRLVTPVPPDAQNPSDQTTDDQNDENDNNYMNNEEKIEKHEGAQLVLLEIALSRTLNVARHI